MSTAIRVGEYILGGHQNCPPGDQWYAGEKNFLANLKKTYFDPAAQAMNQAEALLAKVASSARSNAQQQFNQAEAAIEQSLDDIKDSEETLYEDFSTGCAYTNSGNPISVHMRMIANAEAKKIKGTADKTLAAISNIAKQHPSRVKVAPPTAKAAAKPQPATASRPQPQVISQAAKACIANIQRLIAIGRITPVSVPGGNIQAHCIKTTGKPSNLKGFESSSKMYLAVLLAIIAAAYVWHKTGQFMA